MAKRKKADEANPKPESGTRTKPGAEDPTKEQDSVKQLQRMAKDQGLEFHPDTVEQAKARGLNLGGLIKAFKKYGPMVFDVLGLLLKKMEEDKKKPEEEEEGAEGEQQSEADETKTY
jgi:hypothetical protein